LNEDAEGRRALGSGHASQTERASGPYTVERRALLAPGSVVFDVVAVE
jgi:hypothetical protein